LAAKKMSTSSELVKKVDEGKIIYLEKEVGAKDLVWNAHPAFKGVSLKHLVKGESTNGKFSCHLVKVESNCEIGEHIHEDKWELHEIINGIGKGILADKEIQYKLGVSVVIPERVKHKVIAGEDDLYLLAKFVPALV
jgi:mannose-6-phosphate isomerase-like protein (cupin superfamily)